MINHSRTTNPTAVATHILPARVSTELVLPFITSF